VGSQRFRFEPSPNYSAMGSSPTSMFLLENA
jgi:hypothetical protein